MDSPTWRLGDLLVRVIVVYESKFGNTRRVAETIIEGIDEVERVEAALREPGQVEPAELLGYDLILIGSPNHYGAPTEGVKGFIDGLGEIGLEGGRGAVFDTYLGAGFFGKAVRGMEKRLGERVPGLALVVPGLSVRVERSRGPIAEGELPRCRDFGRRLAGLLDV
jgi:flavodoxin